MLLNNIITLQFCIALALNGLSSLQSPLYPKTLIASPMDALMVEEVTLALTRTNALPLSLSQLPSVAFVLPFSSLANHFTSVRFRVQVLSDGRHCTDLARSCWHNVQRFKHCFMRSINYACLLHI
ncbi:hypothetical protein Hanom_Chr17g01540701 [Helianthus anomalus]